MTSTFVDFLLPISLKAHSLAVSCLALHLCKPVLACGGDDLRWGLPEGELIAMGEGDTDWLSEVSFHLDGAKLGTPDMGPDAGPCVLTLEGHAGAIWGCSFHSCGDFVASCSLDYTVKVWDLQSKRCRSTLRGHAGSVISVEFLPSSSTLVTSVPDTAVSLWDARAGLCAASLYGHRAPCNHGTISGAGDTAALCDTSGVVMLWDVRKAAAPTVTVETGPSAPPTRAVAGDDGAVGDLAALRVARALKHEDDVQSVVFDHRGECLLSGVSGGQIYVWS